MRETRSFISGSRRAYPKLGYRMTGKEKVLVSVFGRANANMASQTKSEFTKKIMTLRSSRGWEF